MGKPNIRIDLPVVRVFNGDLDFAIRLLKKRMDNGGVIGILKARGQNPSSRSRRRFKDCVAERRLKQKKGRNLR